MGKSRYIAHRCEYNGIKFASKTELNRYLILQDDQKNGVISDLECQPEYKFVINGKLVCKYIGDFRYTKDEQVIVEDVKSKVTAKNREYRIKNKLMKAVHGIDIKEVF